MKKFLDSRVVDAMLEVIGKNSIFTVVFDKKDGSERKMICHRGEPTGGTSTIAEHTNLVGVIEEGVGDRCFDKNKVRYLKGAGMDLIARQREEFVDA
jgi:hypothetical protein